MRLSKVLVLIILSMQAACQKDGDDAIPVVSGIEVPFEETYVRCLKYDQNYTRVAEQEWVVRSKKEMEELWDSYRDYCVLFEFPEIDFDKQMLLAYHKKIRRTDSFSLSHSITIHNKTLVCKTVVEKYNWNMTLIPIWQFILIPKIDDSIDIVFEQETIDNVKFY